MYLLTYCQLLTYEDQHTPTLIECHVLSYFPFRTEGSEMHLCVTSYLYPRVTRNLFSVKVATHTDEVTFPSPGYKVLLPFAVFV